HVIVELPAILRRRADRRVQRLLDAERAQLARHHRLEACRVAQRDEVAGALLHGLLDRRFVHPGRGGDHRHVRHERLLLLDDLPDRVWEPVLVDDDDLDGLRFQGLVQLRGSRNPVAVRGVPGGPEYAVDELYVVLAPGQDGDRDALAVVQRNPPEYEPENASSWFKKGGATQPSQG